MFKLLVLRLSHKYNTLPCVISYLVHRAKSSVTPNDLSKFPDFPQRKPGQSQEHYDSIIIAYWAEKKKEKRRAERQRSKLDKKVERAFNYYDKLQKQCRLTMGK